MNHWNLDGETVILRVDFNVPIKNGVITDDTRIVKSLDTVNALLKSNAKLIIMSILQNFLCSQLQKNLVNY